MIGMTDWIDAGFDEPVRGGTTTRAGGVSVGPYARLNLGTQVGDRPAHVEENRRRLGRGLPGPIHWLKQVHGSAVVRLDRWYAGVEADAAWTDQPRTVAAVLTADCLPILLADPDAGVVAIAHAGWRSLALGVIESLVAALPVAPARLHAWIGPGISMPAYEVGPGLRDVFTGLDADHARYFQAGENDRFQADLKGLAGSILARTGVERVRDARLCTHAQPKQFFSHRRDRVTGRMASLIWVEGH